MSESGLRVSGLFEKVMPQVSHKNLLTKRDVLYKNMNLSFYISEGFLIGALFISLYFYRLSIEFEQSIWNEYGLSTQLPRFQEYMIFFLVMMVLWFLWCYHFRLFTLKQDVTMSFSEETIRCIKAISYSVLLTIGIAFVLKLTDYSRLSVLTFWIASMILTIGMRGMKRVFILALSKRGLLVRNVMIIGAGTIGKLVSNELSHHSGLGYNVVGVVDDTQEGEFGSSKIIGKLNNIENIIQQHPVDEIIFTLNDKHKIDHLIQKFRKYDITLRVIPEMFNLMSKTVEIENFNTIPYLTLVKTPMRGLGFIVKRSLDNIFSFIGLLFLLPLFIGVALCIKMDSQGPVFYKQKRVGKNGKLFFMYKFRSMVTNADQIKDQLNELNEAEGPIFKMKNDPRVTKVGKFIRKYSIDELPQLFNVLKGEMSFVGPRPPVPQEVVQYSDWDWRRLEVVPGISGLWQVSGRSELFFDQWVRLDVYYIENWSLWLDLKIIMKTIPVVLKGKGAY